MIRLGLGGIALGVMIMMASLIYALTVPPNPNVGLKSRTATTAVTYSSIVRELRTSSTVAIHDWSSNTTGKIGATANIDR